MTKREAAERNVKAEGNPSNGGIACYPKCPFRKECPHPKINKNKCSGCTNFCKQWLADNPADDWQELNIDDLPRDILKDGVYDLMYKFTTYGSSQGGLWRKSINEALKLLKEKPLFYSFRFRKRQPEKEAPSYDDQFESDRLNNMKTILDRAAMNNGVMGSYDKILFFILSNMKYAEPK